VQEPKKKASGDEMSVDFKALPAIHTILQGEKNATVAKRS